MKTVGQLLKSAREKKSFSYQEVEKQTKIRAKYLEALESDQYDQLPSGTYAKGFIKNYGEFLNLPTKTLLAVFRRDFTENKQGQIIPRSMTNPLSDKKLIWTPQATMISGIVAVVVIFLGFLIFQYQSLFEPKLEVTVPIENEILLGPTVTVAGIADPSSVVSVNDQLVVVESNGEFDTTLEFEPGRHTIVIETTNTRGYQNQIIRNIEVREDQ